MNTALAHSESLNREAKSLAAKQQFEPALEVIDRAIAQYPKTPSLWLTKAMILDTMKRYADAEPAWELMTQLVPGNAAGWFYLGKARAQQHKRETAIAAYRQALAIKPDGLETLVNLADLLMNHKTEYDHFKLQAATQEACTLLTRAVDLNPDSLEARTELGLALMRLGRASDALPHFIRAKQLAPSHKDVVINHAFCLFQMGRFEDAEVVYREGMALGDAYAKFSLAQLLLLKGEWAQGIEYYDARLSPDEVPPRHQHKPIWNGESLSGKTLLVWAEQGIGDEIMFASMLPDVVTQAKHTIVEVEPRLVEMFTRSFPACEVFSHRPANPELSLRRDIDYQIPMGGLMRYVKPKLDYPVGEGFFRASAEKIALYAARYPKNGKKKIGISWLSNRTETSRTRTITLKQWLPILQSKGCEFYNFQYGDTAYELSQLKAETGIEIRCDADVNPLLDMEHMAALMSQMDLVISCANSTVHLAGALGVPVWVLTPKIPSWRWFLERDDSIWYPHVRLFRQKDLWDWSDVVERIADALQAR